MCDSKELLVSYLYDELDSREKASFRTHLASCAECRDEFAGLRATQGHLSAWAPPEPDLGFQIVRRASAQPPPPRPRLNPLWGLAAAAVLVLAAGAALAHIEVRYGSEGLVLRTGWNQTMASSTPTVAGVSASAGGVMPVDWKQHAEALERRLSQLETSAAQPAAVSTRSDEADAAVLRRVSELVGQSEKRQDRVLGVRLTQMAQDIDARRKIDLSLIDQAVMRVQTTNVAELRQSRDLMQRMYRQTAYQPKQ
jgi:anti-sigma factor RsiW